MNRYYDFTTWQRRHLPCRIQKLSVDAGFTCPNRDGTLSTGGCTFCNNKTFTPSYCDRRKSVKEQLTEGKQFFSRKYADMLYLSYFQSFTNTYAPLDHLRRIYEEALCVDGIVGLVIGTRPDCVSVELLDYLQALSHTPLSRFRPLSGAEEHTFSHPLIIIEYGIESANDSTLRHINRGHSFACSRDAIMRSHERGLLTCGHVILGLPGEDAAESLRQASLISSLPLDMLKIHQLQIIRGTALEQEYRLHPFHIYTVDEYVRLSAGYLQHLREDLVIERFVSQTPPELLIAPHWGLKNYEFVHLLTQYMERKDIRQGQLIKKQGQLIKKEHNNSGE